MRAWPVLAVVLLVPVSSFFGLLRPVTDPELEFGSGLFGDVWSPSLWGDVVFVLGTIVAGAVGTWIVAAGLRMGPARIPIAMSAVPVCLLLHWAVYAVSWSLTLEPFMEGLDGGPMSTAWQWQMSYEEPLLGSSNAWTFTWSWGWPGLVASALAAPGAAVIAFRTRTASAPAPATP